MSPHGTKNPSRKAECRKRARLVLDRKFSTEPLAQSWDGKQLAVRLKGRFWLKLHLQRSDILLLEAKFSKRLESACDDRNPLNATSSSITSSHPANMHKTKHSNRFPDAFNPGDLLGEIE